MLVQVAQQQDIETLFTIRTSVIENYQSRQEIAALGITSAIASQLVIYTIFIDNFALTVNHRQTIYGLLATEIILVFIWVVLFLMKK